MMDLLSGKSISDEKDDNCDDKKVTTKTTTKEKSGKDKKKATHEKEKEKEGVEMDIDSVAHHLKDTEGASSGRDDMEVEVPGVTDFSDGFQSTDERMCTLLPFAFQLAKLLKKF